MIGACGRVAEYGVGNVSQRGGVPGGVRGTPTVAKPALVSCWVHPPSDCGPDATVNLPLSTRRVNPSAE